MQRDAVTRRLNSCARLTRIKIEKFRKHIVLLNSGLSNKVDFVFSTIYNIYGAYFTLMNSQVSLSRIDLVCAA